MKRDGKNAKMKAVNQSDAAEWLVSSVGSHYDAELATPCIAAAIVTVDLEWFQDN